MKLWPGQIPCSDWICKDYKTMMLARLRLQGPCRYSNHLYLDGPHRIRGITSVRMLWSVVWINLVPMENCGKNRDASVRCHKSRLCCLMGLCPFALLFFCHVRVQRESFNRYSHPSWSPCSQNLEIWRGGNNSKFTSWEQHDPHAKPDKNAKNKQNYMNRGKNQGNITFAKRMNSTFKRLHPIMKTGFMPGTQDCST